MLPLLIDARVEKDIYQLASTLGAVHSFTSAVFMLSRGMVSLQPQDSVCFSSPYSEECKKQIVFMDKSNPTEEFFTALIEHAAFGIGPEGK